MIDPIDTKKDPMSRTTKHKMFQKGDLVQFDLSKLPVIAGKTYKVINELRNPKHGIIRDVMFRQLGNSTTSFTGAYLDTFLIDLSTVLFTVTANSSLFKAHRGNMSQILVILHQQMLPIHLSMGKVMWYTWQVH